MTIKIITSDNMGNSTEIVNNKLEAKLSSNPNNILRKTESGLEVNHEDIRQFVRDDPEVTRILSGSDATINWMRDFCIFDRFNESHRRLNRLSTSNTSPLTLASYSSSQTPQSLRIKFPFENAGGRKAAGVFNLWYTFKDEPISDRNPVYVANILKCKIAGNAVSSCSPIMIVNPAIQKYTVLNFTESDTDFTISRLPDNTGMTIYVHFLTLSGTWGVGFTR